MMFKRIVVVGSSGAIGGEFVKQLSSLYKDARIYAFARDLKEKIS